MAALGEFFERVRDAKPGGAGQRHGITCRERAAAILGAPLDRHLVGGRPEAYLDLCTAVVVIAAHEPIDSCSMTGDAAVYLAAAMAPHAFELLGGAALVLRRNEFVEKMARETSYWGGWPPLDPDGLRAPLPPRDSPFQDLLAVVAELPLGCRVHLVDALRHLLAGGPRALATLARAETRRRGLDLAESTMQIIGSGLVTAPRDVQAWLDSWTRRDLLAFLNRSGVRIQNSWSKERLAQEAQASCSDVLARRMVEDGAVELCPEYVDAAARLRHYLDEVHETWRIWLAFGTGIGVK